jgi:hypothetical protein
LKRFVDIFVVTTTTGSNHTHLRLFSNSGDALSEEIDVDNSHNSSDAYSMTPSVVVYNSNNDNFVVIWQSNQTVWFKLFDRFANPSSSTQRALLGLSMRLVNVFLSFCGVLRRDLLVGEVHSFFCLYT